MISNLDLKVVRDLRRIKGQAIAVCTVMGCGLAMLIMSRSIIASLEGTRADYYQSHRFGDLFAQLKRAPQWVAGLAAGLPGVVLVQPDISEQVTLDIPGLDEPATGLVRSLPDSGDPELNRLFLRAGDWLPPGAPDAVLVGEAFAEANHLGAGDIIAMLLNGRRRELRISGIVLSPEYVFESRPGAALPDNRTYGVFWMRYEPLARAFDLYGAFNHLSLRLSPGTDERPVIASLDRLLLPYGGQGAYGRTEHPSHVRLSDEIRVLTVLSVGFPLVFLTVAAFMTNAVLCRLVSLQREQIAILKAFGFTDRQVARHYLKFALVIVMAGTLLGTVGGTVLGDRLVIMYRLFFRFPSLAFRLDHPSLVLALGVGATAAAAGVLGAVRRASRLPPAEAMRPEAPASYRPALIERTGIARLFSISFRIAVRNLERKPSQALFTVAGLGLATAILIIPNSIRDGISEVLEFEWDIVQRQDVSLSFPEPWAVSTLDAIRHLPGVLKAEPHRTAAVRIRFGSHHRQLPLHGLPVAGTLERVIDGHSQVLSPSEHGLIISSKLAELFGAVPGDLLQVEVLEGKRRTFTLPLIGLSEELAGMSARMERRALNRLLGEGDLITGAAVSVDRSRWGEFLRKLKGIPRINAIAVKSSLRENFRKTTAASMSLIQSVYLFFATVVAFGVVYNNARISLAERGRELATLRVIGFSEREVGAVLIIELVILSLVAVPAGLLLGTGFATGIIRSVNTETIRLPLVLSSANYAFATLVVALASTLSVIVVMRALRRLDLVGTMKAPE
jgi:putative ABC transport system permease protein